MFSSGRCEPPMPAQARSAPEAVLGRVSIVGLVRVRRAGALALRAAKLIDSRTENLQRSKTLVIAAGLRLNQRFLRP